MDISANITSVWPTTETLLLADTDINYSEHKARAIARAKIALYGSTTVPAEGEIPDLAAYWIIDKAVTLLIPLAKDYYMNNDRLADSMEGANTSFYDKVAGLEQLKRELESNLVSTRDEALSAIGDSEITEAIPAVSSAGMLIDPLTSAMSRGPW